jgi:hypothetical protein
VPDDGVNFLDDGQRVRVAWGGFSIVEATLKFLRLSRDSPEEFSRFLLLTGSDYPIKSSAEINEKLKGRTEFLRVDRRLDTPHAALHAEFVRRWYVELPWGGGPKQMTWSKSRKLYDRFPLYHGSQMWSLTRPCIDFILDFVDRNPRYVRFMRHCKCPDEIFFHSIIKASPFADRISHDFEKCEDVDEYSRSNEHGCHYIDWNAKSVALPKVLVAEDFQRLVNSKALFARKFRARPSQSLLDRIDALVAQK